jgi:hypothetical protein
MAYRPEIQHTIAEMVIELESIGPHLDRMAENWSQGLDYGAEWPLEIFAAKCRAVEASLSYARSGWKRLRSASAWMSSPDGVGEARLLIPNLLPIRL